MPYCITLIFLTSKYIILYRRSDAGAQLLRDIAEGILVHPLAWRTTLERLHVCAKQAEPRHGDAEAAAAVMCARGDTTCRVCHKHAGDPNKLGLPLLLVALSKQPTRPAVEVGTAPVRWDRLEGVATNHFFDKMAAGIGGDLLQ